jgi:hypothetical protein
LLLNMLINSSFILQTKFSYDVWWSRAIVSIFSLLCGYFNNVWIKSLGGIGWVKERLDGNDFDQTGTIFAKIKCIH